MKGGKKQFEKDEYIYDDYVPPRNSKGAMRGGSVRTAEWEQGSRSKVEEQQFAESKRKASEYTFSKPWDLTSHDATDDFQKHVAALDYQTVPPWAGVPADGDVDLTRKLSAISGYEYQPLWKPVEQTMQRMHQNANYRIDPPFQTQFTPSPDSIKPTKRPIPGYNPKTLAPWEHGSQPRASEPMKVQFDMPSTGFWSVPETKPETLIESSGDPVLDSLRLQLKKNGANGILGLARKFRIMDDDDSGSLDIVEFGKAMRECNICDLSKKCIDHLFNYFDKDRSGTLSYDEFLVGVRGVMNPRRRMLVHLAFNVLDKDNSGVIDVEDVRGVYNASKHPDVLSGRKLEETVLNEFLTNFEGPGGTKDGIITIEEFESYYSNISASIDDDDYFELMLRNAWHISGGKGSYANSTNRRVLVTHDDGRQTVEEIKNDIGLRGNDATGIAKRLNAQNISASKVSTTGVVEGSQGRGRGADQSGQPISQKQLQSQYQQQQQSRQQQALERQQPRPHGRLQQPQEQYQVQVQPHLSQHQVQPERLYQYQQSPRGSSSGSVSSYGSSSQRMRPKSLGEHLR